MGTLGSSITTGNLALSQMLKTPPQQTADCQAQLCLFGGPQLQGSRSGHVDKETTHDRKSNPGSHWGLGAVPHLKQKQV